MRRILAMSGAVMFFVAAVLVAQTRGRRWQKYEYEMQDPVDDPPDAWVDREFVFARLRYRSIYDRSFLRGRARWGTDANKSDRLFMTALRRLSRVETRSVEEVLDIDEDQMFNFPWMYAVAVGDWRISPAQAARLREYFDRGGFLMVDDFHAVGEWQGFMDGIHQIYPNARVIEIAEDDPIFHTVYDMNDLVQISGANIIRGFPYERGGVVPHWRAVVDDQDRVQVAICFNMDVGDAWEWSDYPPYPEHLSNLAFRLGVNYAVYSLSH
ncbi:MAG: DUF4159 domain-containing protein [Bryobacteraceae bacterium]